MENRLKVNLQDISVEFQVSPKKNSSNNEIASLHFRAFNEIGFRRKPGRKPTRVRNAPRRKSRKGVMYG